jgi:hypothetical protein
MDLINYLNKQLFVAFMPMHTFSFVVVSALILFCFASRNHSKFKFGLNSK